MTLLVLALGAVVSGIWLGRHRDRATAASGGSYVCPMHPEVTATAPRECPICGMALVKAAILARESAASSDESESGREGEKAIAAAQLLTQAAGGVATSLLTYNAAPVRRRVLQQEPLAPAWIEGDSAAVQLYNDEVGTLAREEQASFYATSDPDVAVGLRYRGAAPVPWDRSTSMVRFELETSGAEKAAATPGWVKLARKSRESVVVPAMSVLPSAEGPYVLVFSAERGTAMKRPIEIGKTFSGMAAVVSGVSGRELVVSMNTFFWDAERRLQAEPRSGGGASP